MREPNYTLSRYNLIWEISHVSDSKTSITLRVPLCRRHNVHH